MFLRQEDLTAGGVAPAFHCRQHHAGKVNKAHASAAVAPLATDGGFNAANRRVIVGVLRLNAEFNKLRNDDFIVVKRGHTKAAADHLHTGVEEVVAHARMVANAEIRLR